MLQIRAIESSEIPLLKDFAPSDWRSDVSALFALHFSRPYFYPIVADLDGTIVGCAQGLLHGQVGWLGNIIVLPDFRGRGIGTALTRHLIEFFRSKACTNQILIATPLGEPVYRKLGFETVAGYLAMRNKVPAVPEDVPPVRRLDPKDSDAILAMDRAITGEERKPFLSRYLSDGWVHETPSHGIDAFFLPGLGQGPILAQNDRAGLALLGFKARQGRQEIVIPEANRTAVEFLRERGFHEARRLPRMALGGDTSWQPDKIFSRGTGYCG